MDRTFDVIVIGAGHAGCEAALAAAKLGSKTLLLTLNYHNIAFMPCNPSIGGPAKGHLVREIDALGGVMGRIIDRTYLQMRLLNTQKGPAVWALRAQADKLLYQRTMQQTLEAQPNLEVRQGEVTEILFDDMNNTNGVKTRTGLVFSASAIILATGTFLRGRIFIGKMNYPSGPMGNLPAEALGSFLQEMDLHIRRFKTGTPARVRRRSLDFSKMVPQPGGFTAHGFSFWEPWQVRPEHLCWLTYTQHETHRVVREHLREAALFTGDIIGVGPRYCPSIESKLINFPDKERHQVFIEPEGEDTEEMYLAGLSSSLPEAVQEEFLRTIPGLENVKIVRPAYAIEYDVISGDEIQPSLELKKYPGLFAAGQINGSSGYEEAAAQGLIAGINATLRLRGKPPLILKRSEAYLGVLIDDLVMKENLEPYRLLTSRAEYRLSLRANNADERLSPYALGLGLLTSEERRIFRNKTERMGQFIHTLEQMVFTPEENTRKIFTETGISPPRNKFSLAELLRRPDVDMELVYKIAPDLDVEPLVAEEIETRLKYEGYLAKEREQAKKLLQLENRTIPDNIDYMEVTNLAREAREKLERFRPRTMGQASRISGINPADMTALLFYLENRKRGDHHGT